MQPFITQDQSGLAQGILGASTTLAQALQSRGKAQAQEQVRLNDKTILNSLLSDPDVSTMELMKGISKLSPDSRKSVIELFKPRLQEEAKFERSQKFLKSQGIIPTIEGDAQGNRSEVLPGYSENKPKVLSENQIKALVTSTDPQQQALGKYYQDQRKLLRQNQKDLWDYRPTQKFIETTNEVADSSEFGNEVADNVIQLVSTGKVDPYNIRNFLAGQVGEHLPFLFTEETASLKLLEKLQAKGLKEIFPRPTEREFFFINAAQSQLGKSNEANIAVAHLQKKFNEIPIKKREFMEEVIEENDGVPPRDLQARVRKKMKAHKDYVFDEAAKVSYNHGTMKQRIEAAQHLKYKNLQLTGQKMDEITALSDNDPDKAERNAKLLGYDITQYIE